MSSGGGTTTIPPQEKNPQAFKRAVRKIKCAAMVANLAKSWQGWATEHSSQQDSIPSGWMPNCIEGEEDEKEPKKVTKLTVTPRVITTDNNSDGTSKIRACTVTKSIQPKLSECGGRDVVNAIRGKMESGPDESSIKPFLGNESPTRRRQMRALENAGGGGGGGGGGGAIQTRKSMLIGSQNGSVDAEDSGLEEDNMEALTEQGEIKTVNKKTDRPKIKISTMGDIKSRWQQWSVQHVEGQKLNPFSEEFDHDYAMSTRLRKGDSGYGRPKDGSKTAERGDRAQKHVYKEMEEMVWIIKDMGIKDKEGRIVISFGRLFDRYVKISDKVVGILLRCRKHKMVDFEGEMLWKGQDDHVIITVRETEEGGE